MSDIFTIIHVMHEGYLSSYISDEIQSIFSADKTEGGQLSLAFQLEEKKTHTVSDIFTIIHVMHEGYLSSYISDEIQSIFSADKTEGGQPQKAWAVDWQWMATLEKPVII